MITSQFQKEKKKKKSKTTRKIESLNTKVVYSVSAPVSVWPLEWNIRYRSISAFRFGFTANIYIYIISNYRQITSNNTNS